MLDFVFHMDDALHAPIGVLLCPWHIQTHHSRCPLSNIKIIIFSCSIPTLGVLKIIAGAQISFILCYFILHLKKIYTHTYWTVP